jgi:hypothetical protein
LAVAIGCFAIAACQPGALIGPQRSSAASAELASLARYGNRVRQSSAVELEREYRELLTQMTTSSAPGTRLRLALLLSVPDAEFHDRDEALRMLTDLVAAPEGEPRATQDFAELLYSLLNERTCVTAPDRPLAELLIAERERNRRLGTELDATRATLAAERAHRETLQGQLDALKSLEERLLDGERASEAVRQ